MTEIKKKNSKRTGGFNVNISSNVIQSKVQNQMRLHNQLLEKQMAALSSGRRINGASDDAAGLSISTRMESQIRGKQQAISNVKDGLSLLQTADGASGSILLILQRQRELAVQAANGTYNDTDREALNSEFSQLNSEIDNIANGTNFNGINLLNQSGLPGVDPQTIEDLKAQIPHWIDDAMIHIQNVLGLNTLPTGINVDVQFYYDATTGTRASMSGVPGTTDYTLKVNLGRLLDTNNEIPGGTGTYPDAITGGDFDTVIAHEMTHNIQFTMFPGLSFSAGEMWFIEGLASAVQGRNTYYNMSYANKADALVSYTSWNGDYEASFAAIKTLHEITTGGMQAVIERLEQGDTLDQAIQNTTQGNGAELTGAADFNSVSEFLDWFNTSADVDNYLNTSADFNAGEGALLPGQGNSNPANKDGVVANNTTIETGANNGGIYTLTFADVQNGTITLHTGSESDTTLEIAKADLTTYSLGLTGLSFGNTAQAQQAIRAIDEAIERITSVRSGFGSSMNRLDYISQNLTDSQVQTSAAKSRIVDADMAKTYSDYSKEQVFINSSISMLKQVQQNTQNVLQLLKF